MLRARRGEILAPIIGDRMIEIPCAGVDNIRRKHVWNFR